MMGVDLLSYIDVTDLTLCSYYAAINTFWIIDSETREVIKHWSFKGTMFLLLLVRKVKHNLKLAV